MFVSVVLPVYNCEKYVFDAVHSILKQTHSNFELIIVDDASTDLTCEVLGNIKDARIRLFKNSENKGIVFSLNFGISLANGKYIFRMDADDLAEVDRLKVQIDYFEQSPNLFALGGAALFFSSVYNFTKKWNVPRSSIYCKTHLLFSNCFVHSSVAFRAITLKKYNLAYDSDYLHAEDYALWIRAFDNGCIMENLRRPLVRYRVHPMSISVVADKNEDHRFSIIKKIYLSQFHKYIDCYNKNNVLKLHYQFSYKKYSKKKFTSSEIRELCLFYKELLNANHFKFEYSVFYFKSRVLWLAFIAAKHKKIGLIDAIKILKVVLS